MKKRDKKHFSQKQIWIRLDLWNRIKAKAVAEKRTMRMTIEMYLDRVVE